MTYETDLFTALTGLVGGRVYPQTFLQPSGELPEWPAIRYTFLSISPVQDLCSDGDDETSTTRVRIDAVSPRYAGMKALRQSVMLAMQSFPVPARLLFSTEMFDTETRTHRAMMDFGIFGSSPDVS